MGFVALEVKIMSNTTAIIICYEPSADFVKNLTSIYSNYSKVIIIDNSPSEKIRSLINLSHIEYYFMNNNLGTAGAINWYLNNVEDTSEIVSIFDQDSSIISLSNMDKILNDEVDVIYPVYLKNGKRYSANTVGELSLPFMSGLTVRREIFEKVGYMDENLFLDYVDFDFDIRAFLAGIRFTEDAKFCIEHNLGSSSEHFFMGKKFFVSHHSSDRRYSITRNRIVLYRKYMRNLPKWIVFDLRSFIYETLGIILFEEYKVKKLRAVSCGIYKGIIK